MSSSIKIIDSEEQVLEPVNQTLCEICQKQFSNYVCPRCNLRYCSLACYKDIQHADCTESFYKDAVTAEIQNRDLDRDSKNKMLEMLKRLEEENDPNALLDSDNEDENEDEDGLQHDWMARFANIDLDNTDSDMIWDLLSDKEREEFQQVMQELQKTGNWDKLNLPTYQPWWKQQQQQKQHNTLIYEGEEEEEEEDQSPRLPDTIPDFSKMTQPATRESPHLAWNLLHLLGTYGYLMRHTMGNLLEDSEDTAATCQVLSASVLYSQAAECPFKSVSDVAIDLTEQIIRREDATVTTSKRNYNSQRRYDLRLLVLQDMELLLPHRVRAMHHFWKTVDTLASQSKKKKNKKPVLLAARKLYFYLAAAGYLDKDRQSIIQLALQNEISRVDAEKKEFAKEYEAAQDAIQQHHEQTKESNKIKIQEL